MIIRISYNAHSYQRKIADPQAANLIAIRIMRADPRINSIDIINAETAEIVRTYTR